MGRPSPNDSRPWLRRWPWAGLPHRYEKGGPVKDPTPPTQPNSGEGGPETARRRALITAAVVLVLVYVAVTFAAMHRPI